MTPTIRLVAPEDAEAVREIYEPHVRGSAVSFELTPPSAAAVARRIRDTLETYPWLVCERDGSVAGYAYAAQHRPREASQWAVESSIYVHADHRRAGVARGLYEALFAVLGLQEFRNVYAGTTLPNPASVGFHESMGFEPIGVYEGVGFKDGEWHDVQWWHRRLGDPEASPDPPLSVSEAREHDGWDDALAAGAPSVRG
jgi:phosphinothricin acetyltransferase